MNLITKARALLSLRAAFKKAEREMENYRPMKLKPGIETSEFWLVVGFGLADTALAGLGMVDGSIAAAALAILGSIYTAARGMVKARLATPPPAPGVQINK